MVYRKNSGHIAFNDYDITEFMMRQFNKANNIEELHLIKNTFDEVMDNVIKKISRTMDSSIIEQEEEERRKTEELMRYWRW